MIRIEINFLEFFVENTSSVLEACEYVGVSVPRFCYHPELSIAGNCRMCLVELSNSTKPIVSCSLPVLNNMKVFINTPSIKKARENILELLLLNHPLDCPICDQGGECDLQDQAKSFGISFNKNFFNRRVVEDKNCGFLIKTIMTRCIHCTRCVRFNEEISGNDFFGTINRGVSTEISSYSKTNYSSEISACVIDLCPVGALTSKPYSFKARPWELKTSESIDLLDGLGSNIYISFKDVNVVRVFPKINYEINGSIISDRSRFFFDSNHTNRLTILNDDSTFLNFRKGVYSKNFSNLLMTSSWFYSENSTFLKNVKFPKVIFLLSKSTSLYILYGLKLLENSKFFNTWINNKVINFKSYSLNFSVKPINFFINWINNIVLDINLITKVIFLISSNLSLENPIINTKLRNKKIKNNIFSFGFLLNFKENFQLNFFNLNLSKFLNIFESKNFNLSNYLIKYKNVGLIYSESLFTRGLDNHLFIGFVKKINYNIILINIQMSSNLNGGNFLNFSSINHRILKKTNYIFAINLNLSYFLSKTFNTFNSKILWFNTHKINAVEKNYNFFKKVYNLSCASDYEEDSLFCNLEQRFQKVDKILLNINTISVLNHIFSLFYLEFINTYKLTKAVFTIKKFSFLIELINKKFLFCNLKIFKVYNFIFLRAFSMLHSNFSLYPSKFVFENDYLTNKFLRNSKVMLTLSQLKRKESTNFFSN
jgi:NADH dehydrogenase/NADH:ubiquinone oxidoreductase subunit G